MPPSKSLNLPEPVREEVGKNTVSRAVSRALDVAQLSGIPGLKERVLISLSGIPKIKRGMDISILPGVDDRRRAGYTVTLADGALDCSIMGSMMWFLREHPTRIVPLVKGRK